MKTLQKLLYYWISAFIFAVLGYYLLGFIIKHPFASWYRMIRYHFGHPLQYIGIVVFFYGITATLFSKRFKNSKRKILFSMLIAFITILLASPFGGMLWNYHDMQAGWFPQNWANKLLGGFIDGLGIGWFLILLSFPYNILGLVVNYYLLKHSLIK